MTAVDYILVTSSIWLALFLLSTVPLAKENGFLYTTMVNIHVHTVLFSVTPPHIH